MSDVIEEEEEDKEDKEEFNCSTSLPSSYSASSSIPQRTSKSFFQKLRSNNSNNNNSNVSSYISTFLPSAPTVNIIAVKFTKLQNRDDEYLLVDEDTNSSSSYSRSTRSRQSSRSDSISSNSGIKRRELLSVLAFHGEDYS